MGFTLAAVGFLLFGVVVAVEAIAFQYHSLPAEATVTAIGEQRTCVRNAGKSGSEKYPCFPVDYRFTTGDGPPVNFTERRAADALPAIGDRATVRYDPGAPATDIRFEQGLLDRYSFPLSFLLIGAVGTAVGGTLLRRYRSERSERTG